MPVVPLPPMNAAEICLPDPPADPPTFEDITNARRYLNLLDENQRLACDAPIATHDDLSNAQLYLHKLCDRRAHFERDTIITVASFRQIFREELSEALLPLKEILEENLQVARGGNDAGSGSGSGERPGFEIIPFTNEDGTETTPMALGLPALKTIEDIESLTDADLNVYIKNYEIPRQGNLSRNTKIRRLREFVVGREADD